jgi:hypothetical protein
MGTPLGGAGLPMPVKDPLRTPVDRGGPIPQSWLAAPRALPRASPSTLATCITMHRRSRAKLPVAAIRAVDDMRHSAARRAGNPGPFTGSAQVRTPSQARTMVAWHCRQTMEIEDDSNPEDDA